MRKLKLSVNRAWPLCLGFMVSSMAFSAEKLTTQQLVRLLQTNPKSVIDRVPPKEDAFIDSVQTLEDGSQQEVEVKQDQPQFDEVDILTEGFVDNRNQSKEISDAIKNRLEFAKEEQLVIYFDKKFNKEVTVSVKDLGGRAPIKGNDQAEYLVDRGRDLVTKIQNLEIDNKLNAKLDEQHRPWSDDYWAIKNGILAARYADPDFNDAVPWDATWKSLHDLFYDLDPNDEYDLDTKNYVLEQELRVKDTLSPAEKYDILVSGVKGPFNLTNRMWKEGEVYWNRYGKVESWMGICHGWAPAAYMEDRPVKPVEVLSVDGYKIKFFPADIKALGSLLWAKVSPGSKFIGGRCNVKSDEENIKDSVIGRIKPQECFDTNPGSWHMSIVNQIGYSNRSFVMDATYDYEVWNQPVYSYQYQYFNPQTGAAIESIVKEDGTLDTDKLVKLAEWKQDRFQNGEVDPSTGESVNYRKNSDGQMAPYLIGVKMKVGYIVETQPQHLNNDNSSLDAITYVTYHYDLELTEDGTIVGGEWYSNRHPDFLWTPTPDAQAKSPYERWDWGWPNWQAGEINEEGQLVNKLPNKWAQNGEKSAVDGIPLSKIIKTLTALSRQ